MNTVWENSKLKILNKNFHLIAITAHFSKHQFLEDISGYYNNKISWINWHRIALLLYNLLERPTTIDYETRLMADDLYELLVKKGLRHFGGLDVFQFIEFLQKQSTPVFFNAKTAQYRGDFIGFIESYSEIPKLKHFNQIFFDKDTDKFFSFQLKEEIQSINAPLILGGNNE